MTVVTVLPCTSKTKQGNCVHSISFRSPNGIAYTAEEMNDSPASSFKTETVATFECTNPGVGGKKDWVRFVGISDGRPPIQRDSLDIAKVAFSCAVQVGIKMDWPEEAIIEKAMDYAVKIKSIAELI